MNRKTLITILLITMYVISSVWAFYIGRFETIYGAGAALVMVIQILGLVAALISWVIPPRSLLQSLKFGMMIITGLQMIMIVGHEIDEYKPTYVVKIPENFSGCVYLFSTPGPRGDVQVNSNGIGYIGSHGKAIYEVHRGGKDISAVFNISQLNELVIYSSDSLQMKAISVQCLPIDPEDNYISHENPFTYLPCMEEVEYEMFLEYGLIIEDSLRIKAWKRPEINDKAWQFDHSNARM